MENGVRTVSESVASDFMREMVAQSGMFRQARVHKIPFGIRPQVFRKRDKREARAWLGVGAEDFVLGTRVTSSEFKGTVEIRALLKRINAAGVSVITFDEKHLLDDFKDRYQIVDMGWVENDDLMARIYSACDVFLAPSKAESFGMMAIEAMACGTPVVAFDNTAMSMGYGKAGILVADGNVHELHKAVERLRNDRDFREEVSAREVEFVLENYLYDESVRKILACYKRNNE